MILKKYISLLFVLLISLPVFAQTDESDPFVKKALCFSFNGFEPGGVFGGIGGKLWFWPDKAIVVGIDYQDLQNGDSGNEESSVDIGFEKHNPVIQDISAFWGVRIGQYSSKETENKIQTITTAQFFGVYFGGEYFFQERLSFSVYTGLFKYTGSSKTASTSSITL